MIRSAIFCLSLGLGSAAASINAETLITTDGAYTAGVNGNSFVSIFEQSDISYTYAYGSGWALDRAHPEDLLTSIQAGYSTAALKGVYVKPCQSDTWDKIEGTVYDYQGDATETQDGANYLFDIYHSWNSAEPAGKLNDTYACGGSYARYQTYTGYQTVRTGGEVKFAFVLEFSNDTNTSCADAYLAGASYATGDIVSHYGAEYQCKVGGWCSQGDTAGWAYEPGQGSYWTEAWQQVEVCN
ncbi:hypothetical protein TDB9533_02668 [Thalassocella blandensis]|nr:hypothetical protein TDB9533_02668 [Thalassocella blandensis]